MIGPSSELDYNTPRKPYNDRPASWTGTGFMRVVPNSKMEFPVDNIQESKLYDIVVRYEPQSNIEWDNVQLTLKRYLPIDAYGPCGNYSRNPQDIQTIKFSLERYAVARGVCLEKNGRYTVELQVNQAPRDADPRTENVLIDSIVIIPRYEDIPFFTGSPENERRRQDFERFRCQNSYYTLNRAPEPDEYCQKMLTSVGFYTFNGATACNCNVTGSTSAQCNPFGGACTCKLNVAERTCSRCHVGFYGFGPEGCKGMCQITSLSQYSCCFFLQLAIVINLDRKTFIVTPPLASARAVREPMDVDVTNVNQAIGTIRVVCAAIAMDSPICATPKRASALVANRTRLATIARNVPKDSTVTHWASTLMAFRCRVKVVRVPA